MPTGGYVVVGFQYSATISSSTQRPKFLAKVSFSPCYIRLASSSSASLLLIRKNFHQKNASCWWLIFQGNLCVPHLLMICAVMFSCALWKHVYWWVKLSLWAHWLACCCLAHGAFFISLNWFCDVKLIAKNFCVDCTQKFD